MSSDSNPPIIEACLPVKYFGKGGRKPGSRNKVSATAKRNIEAVFDGLGGWEAMMNWARFHPNEFYVQIYPRILANEGMTKGSGDIRVLVYAPGDAAKDTEELEDDTQPVVVGAGNGEQDAA